MRSRALLVALLVVTAGCGSTGGLFDDGTPTETLTPAPVPTVERTATPRRTLPDGLDRTGINNSVILGETHEDAITDQSYTWHQRYVEVRIHPEGNQTLRRVKTTRVEDAGTYRHEVRTVRQYLGNESERYRLSTYANGHRWVERFGVASNGTAFNWSYSHGAVDTSEDRFADRAALLVSRFLTVERSTTALVRRNGELRYRVVANGSSLPNYPDGNNYSAVLLVGTDGIIYRWELWVTRQFGDVTERIHYVWRYEDVGETTVRRPDWADVPDWNTTTTG